MVLIIQDGRTFRRALREAVVSQFPDLDVREAGSLAEADGIVRSQAPSLVLMDVSLPDGNGLDWARRLRVEAPGTTVVPTLNHDLPEYREAARTSGLGDCLVAQRIDWIRLNHLLRQAVPALRPRA